MRNCSILKGFCAAASLLSYVSEAYIPFLFGHKKQIHHPFSYRVSSSRHDKQEPSDGDSSSSGVISFFEDAVRQATGDESYNFGDLTKKTLSDLTGKDLEKESYQFGDVTRNALSKTGQAVLGDDQYEFGDLTRAKLQEIEQAMEEWKGLEKDPFRTLFGRAMSDLDPKQRKNLILGLLRLGAILLLTWGFVASLVSAVIVSVAWTMALQSSLLEGMFSVVPIIPLGPNTTLQLWRTFIARYVSLRLFLGPLLLVLQGAGTVLWFRRYSKFVDQLSKVVDSTKDHSQKFALMRNLRVLILAFLCKNVLLSSLVAAAGMVFGGLATCFFAYVSKTPVGMVLV